MHFVLIYWNIYFLHFFLIFINLEILIYISKNSWVVGGGTNKGVRHVLNEGLINSLKGPASLWIPEYANRTSIRITWVHSRFSCCSIFSFLCNVLFVVFVLLSFFHFTIVLSVLLSFFHFTIVLSVLWFTLSDYPFDILRIFSVALCLLNPVKGFQWIVLVKRWHWNGPIGVYLVWHRYRRK
jgi:hypothetical protein